MIFTNNRLDFSRLNKPNLYSVAPKTVYDRSECLQALNSALVKSLKSSTTPIDPSNPVEAITKCVQSDAFEALLGAVSELSKTKRISVLEASENLIKVIHDLEFFWKSHVLQEGLNSLQKQLVENQS